MKTYRDLIVWQKSMSFVTEVYKATADFPKEEVYGLTMQIRRSSVSIPSNIAEGYGRNSTGDYMRFLQISMGQFSKSRPSWKFPSILDFLKRINSERFMNPPVK